LEAEFIFGMAYFHGRTVSFREGNHFVACEIPECSIDFDLVTNFRAISRKTSMNQHQHGKTMAGTTNKTNCYISIQQKLLWTCIIVELTWEEWFSISPARVRDVRDTPLKTNITMEHKPFEDVFPIENEDFPMSC